MPHKNAIVIGAGIVGMAMAKSLAEKGYTVTVFERNEKAIGASIRNFGMIWPVGQPTGFLYERALRSKAAWKQVCGEAKLWYSEKGSVHAAYNDLEWQVINEVYEAHKSTRPVSILNSEETLQKSAVINPHNLKGALFSEDEMTVESRVAIEKLPAYLTEKYNIQFHFNTAATAINYPNIIAAKKQYSADEIFICSGADFETLYPEVFAANNFTKCKLQMMRFVTESPVNIGPSLCGGLSLIHYKSFEAAASLPQLKSFYQQTFPEYLQWGIHVMVSQNGEGELTIGDSHEYELAPDPFDKQFINQLILDYLKQFTTFNMRMQQSWNGIYPKLLTGKTDFIHSPTQGVTIVNGLGGAGMTLSFGLAEEVVARL